jgi:hypothetical protein
MPTSSGIKMINAATIAIIKEIIALFLGGLLLKEVVPYN